ncbi:MAG: hypothetical protein OJF62_000320 [Pseudolabrys sp.]|jgi:hypothetical protein|nr:hypothetical protein [Pseudolabrys sp.]
MPLASKDAQGTAPQNRTATPIFGSFYFELEFVVRSDMSRTD